MSYPCQNYCCAENHNGECMGDGCRKVSPPSWETERSNDNE